MECDLLQRQLELRNWLGGVRCLDNFAAQWASLSGNSFQINNLCYTDAQLAKRLNVELPDDDLELPEVLHGKAKRSRVEGIPDEVQEIQYGIYFCEVSLLILPEIILKCLARHIPPVREEERRVPKFIANFIKVKYFWVVYARVTEVVETGSLEQHVHVLEARAERNFALRLLSQLRVCLDERFKQSFVISTVHEHLQLFPRYRQRYVGNIFVLFVELL